MGGTVAQMLAMAEFQRTGRKQRLVTFGAPKGGNQAYEEMAHMATTHTRFHHGHDPSTQFPLELSRKTFAAHSAYWHIRLMPKSKAIRTRLSTERDMQDPIAEVEQCIGDFNLYKYASALVDEVLNSTWARP